MFAPTNPAAFGNENLKRLLGRASDGPPDAASDALLLNMNIALAHGEQNSRPFASKMTKAHEEESEPDEVSPVFRYVPNFQVHICWAREIGPISTLNVHAFTWQTFLT